MRWKRNKVRIICGLAAVVLCIGAAAVAGAGGSMQDPLVSLSYIKQTYLPEIAKKAQTAVNTAYNALFEKAAANAERKMAAKLADFYIAATGLANAGDGFCDVRMYKGDAIKLGVGTKVVIKSGGAVLKGAAASEYIDISAGTAVKSGGTAQVNREYLAADDKCVIESSDYYTTAAVRGSYTLTRAYTAKNNGIADGLKEMGLFLGTGSGYDLERPATRIEAAVMLIRLLGQETQALGCTDKNPFSDVPEWADRYAAYAYAKGYTKGTSANKFSPAAEVTDEQYFTFILRALGYSDTDGEFAWDNASEFAQQKSVVSASDVQRIKNAVFRRDEVVYISRNALYAKLKDSNARLIDSLILNGAVSSDSLKRAEKISGFAK